ncbi:hypothetical protein AVEN_42662-1 [Araneus ventricosus]|uniref:Uncharacterized protein n=1 Tax=Araneus ventricosus TaxID=182803 RepID=A0A4Y2BPU4_ARAVE|nr:hypothetical protein AVEN_42662-1 [Araneus ventricosus]
MIYRCPGAPWEQNISPLMSLIEVKYYEGARKESHVPGAIDFHRAADDDCVFPLVWCRSLERGCRLKCRPLRLTTVQNYVVNSKIALTLLQNGTLM